MLTSAFQVVPWILFCFVLPWLFFCCTCALWRVASLRFFRATKPGMSRSNRFQSWSLRGQLQRRVLSTFLQILVVNEFEVVGWKRFQENCPTIKLRFHRRAMLSHWKFSILHTHLIRSKWGSGWYLTAIVLTHKTQQFRMVQPNVFKAHGWIGLFFIGLKNQGRNGFLISK